MEQCATCESLMPRIDINSPRLLCEVAESVVPYVRDGRLQQLPVAVLAVDPHGVTSVEEVSRGERSDLVSLTFRCATCGTRYRLAADTYHGGGIWERERASASRV